MKLSDVMNVAVSAVYEVVDDIDVAVSAIQKKYVDKAAEKSDAVDDTVEENASEVQETTDETAEAEDKQTSELTTEGIINAEKIIDVDVETTERTIIPDEEPVFKAKNEEKRGIQKDMKNIIEKIKKLVAEGNVDRIVVKKDGDVVLNIPVNVGIVGGLVGIYSAPWLVAITAITAYGFKYEFEIIRKDGTVDEVK